MLQKQISELQAKMIGECESILTDAQKQLLASRRRAAVDGKNGDGAVKTTKDGSKTSQ